MCSSDLAGAFAHSVVAADRDGNAAFYLNGAADGAVDMTSRAGDTSNAIVARIGMTSSGAGLVGVLDELRVSSVARSAAWIAADYANQSSPATFYSVA